MRAQRHRLVLFPERGTEPASGTSAPANYVASRWLNGPAATATGYPYTGGASQAKGLFFGVTNYGAGQQGQVHSCWSYRPADGLAGKTLTRALWQVRTDRPFGTSGPVNCTATIYGDEANPIPVADTSHDPEADWNLTEASTAVSIAISGDGSTYPSGLTYQQHEFDVTDVVNEVLASAGYAASRRINLVFLCTMNPASFSEDTSVRVDYPPVLNLLQ